jgi:hypothetical protein
LSALVGEVLVLGGGFLFAPLLAIVAFLAIQLGF